jgi:hypothetical protein
MMKTSLAAAGHTKLPDTTHGVSRTISVAARRVSRFSPLRVKFPEWMIKGTPRPQYDAELAWELLASTGEIPSSRRRMFLVLHEYRYALHDMLTTGCACENRRR